MTARGSELLAVGQSIWARLRVPVFAFLLASSCATSPLGRKQVLLLPSSQMDSLGATAFQELKSKGRVLSSGAPVEHTRCVVRALLGAESAQWEVQVFEESSANAFALPGKKIGVHTGLLKVAQTPDQLAAVIGHEITHVRAEHGNERVSQQLLLQGGLVATAAILKTDDPGEAKSRGILMAALGVGAQFGVTLPHSRSHESEADLIGQNLMADAGFDPSQAIALWQNMAASGGASPPEWMSTHPSHSTRIQDLRENLSVARPKFERARAAGKNPRCQR